MLQGYESVQSAVRPQEEISFGCVGSSLSCANRAGEAAHMFKTRGQHSALRHLYDQPVCPSCLKFYHTMSKMQAHLYYSQECRTRLREIDLQCQAPPGTGSRCRIDCYLLFEDKALKDPDVHQRISLTLMRPSMTFSLLCSRWTTLWRHCRSEGMSRDLPYRQDSPILCNTLLRMWSLRMLPSLVLTSHSSPASLPSFVVGIYGKTKHFE